MQDSSNKLQKLLFRDNLGEFRQGTVCFFFSNQQTILEFWHANIVHQKTKHRISKKLFTCHSTNIIYTSKNNKDRNCLMKLVIVRSYNQYMGGADCVDQQLNDIHILRKS